MILTPSFNINSHLKKIMKFKKISGAILKGRNQINLD